jgi:hypothetical protein
MAFKWRFQSRKGIWITQAGRRASGEVCAAFWQRCPKHFTAIGAEGQIETPRLEQLPRPNEATNRIKAGAAITRPHMITSSPNRAQPKYRHCKCASRLQVGHQPDSGSL